MKYTPQDGFLYYFNLVKNTSCKSLFTSLSTIMLLDAINEEKAAYCYEPKKWSIKQVVGHITDHERIKMFRAFLMSRNEQVELWGYDQNFLVNNSRFNELTMRQLITDYKNVRQASISFVKSLSKNQLQLKGFAGEYKITLEDFLKSIIGHEYHHVKIIKNRYL